MSATTWRLARTTLLAAAVGLSACTVHQPQPTGPRSDEPIQSLPGTPPGSPSRPKASPGVPSIPTPKPAKTSASFAPPPGGNSHWDQRLGVYVLDGKANTFYRQRTYYQWNNGWSWSTQPDGPWQATDANGVPGGLGREFGN